MVMLDNNYLIACGRHFVGEYGVYLYYGGVDTGYVVGKICGEGAANGG